jgi:gas vesicle protein
MAKNNTKRFVLSTILAAITGYVAGLLSAPKSGKETRQDLKDATVSTVAAAEKQLRRLEQEMAAALTEAKAEIAKLSGQAKLGLDEAVQKTKVAEARVKQLLGAIHTGGADDKDLQKAINEATKAVRHLQSFFTKP